MSNLEAIVERLKRKAAAECFSIAVDVQGEARKNLSGPVLSPATGNLRNAVQVVPLPAGQIGYAVGVTASPNPDNGQPASAYGAAWEYGHEKPDGTAEPPRAFMRPAVEAVKARRR